MQYRFLKMQRPKTTVGNITASVAQHALADTSDGDRQ